MLCSQCIVFNALKQKCQLPIPFPPQTKLIQSERTISEDNKHFMKDYLEQIATVGDEYIHRCSVNYIMQNDL